MVNALMALEVSLCFNAVGNEVARRCGSLFPKGFRVKRKRSFQTSSSLLDSMAEFSPMLSQSAVL